MHTHDWNWHLSTIREMEKEFMFLDIGMDEIHKHDVMPGMVVQCSCSELIEARCKQLCYNIDANGNPVRDEYGTITTFNQGWGGLCYEESNEDIKKELRRIAAKQLQQENLNKQKQNDAKETNL